MTGRQAALVTGATRRIGAAIARALARQGYALALHSSERSRAQTEELANAIIAAGGRAGVICADLAAPEELARLVAAAGDLAGPLTLLVNNASLFESDSAAAPDPALWERHFAVNLRAPVFLASAFASVCERPAAIVNILDQRVWRLNPQYFSYTLSKAALWTATQTLAQTFAPDIRVNAVGPGPVLPNLNDGEDGFRREAENVPLARAVDPDEVADAVVYLAKARAVTGQMICVDGGQHIAWKTPDVAP